MILLALLACGADAPQAEPPFQRQQRQCESGVVTSTIPAGPYSYIGYTTAAGEERWLASLALQTPPTPGTTADFVRYGEQHNFHSDRLDRDFAVLFFGFLGTC